MTQVWILKKSLFEHHFLVNLSNCKMFLPYETVSQIVVQWAASKHILHVAHYILHST